jgi:formylmethanofuran dehydrogenase subunit D
MLVKPTVKMANHLHICFLLTFLSQKVNKTKMYRNACTHCCDDVQCSALSVAFNCVVVMSEPSGEVIVIVTRSIDTNL